jgi:glycosyltransferase 2 family protein
MRQAGTLAGLLVGLIISGICVVVLVSQIDLQQTWSTLTHPQPAWLLLTVVALLLTMASKACRWSLLYYPTRGLRFGSLLSALFVGYTVSFLVPLRLGELVRALLVVRREPVSLAQTAGTILVERILDLITILGFLVLLAALGQLPPLAVPGTLLLAVGAGGIAALVGLAWLPRDRLLGLLAHLQRYLPSSPRWDLARLVGPFLEALAILRYRRLLPPLAAWSVLGWLLTALIDYTVMRALDVPAPFSAAIFLMVVVNLGAIVPSAPGAIGVFHGLVAVTLALYGVDPSVAAGYAVLLYAVTNGSLVAGGLYCAWRTGYGLADLRGSAAEAARSARRPPLVPVGAAPSATLEARSPVRQP